MDVGYLILERIEKTDSFEEFVFTMSDLIIKLSNSNEETMIAHRESLIKCVAGLMIGIAPVAAHTNWDACKKLLRKTYEDSKAQGPIQ